jgi:hypothetical protein
MLTVLSPVYIVGAKATCWKCGAANEVVTLASKSISDDANDVEQAEPQEMFLLSYITEMPPEVFESIVGVAPNYRKLYTRTADQEYYANVCACGANFGDFYLFSEPGGAWFPEDGAEIETTRVLTLPFSAAIQVDGEFSSCRMNIEVGA